MPRRGRAKWIAISAVYGLALVLLAALIGTESDASARTKLIEGAVFVVAPAIVFFVAAAPLWHESQNRLWLTAAGTVSFVAAVVLAVVTFGFAFPVSCGLVAVAIADFDRVLRVSGFRGSSRTVSFAVVLLIAGGLVGLAIPIAATVAVIGLAILVWRLVATRPRRPARGA
jgi:hypothetical protein